ncbi:MAG: ArsR/SmtB family transcription factor [Candidatus Baldrarchaeia archaeon]
MNHLMEESFLDTMARFFRALSDPIRLKILKVIMEHGEESICQCDIIPATGRSQSTVAQHLKNLVESGILIAERRGRSIYYRISDPRVLKILDLAAEILVSRISRSIKALRF